MKKTITTILAALALAGCTSQKSMETIDITGKWNIEEAMGQSTENGENQAFINFGSNGQMNGNASVNLFNGSYKLDGEHLTLYNIGMTRMMGASMEVEDAVTNALNATKSIKTEDERVIVLDSKNNTVMVLAKEGATPAKPREQLVGAYGEYHKVSKEETDLFLSTYKGDIELTPKKVSTQVVAGMNYSFWCQDKAGKNYEVIIFQPLPGQGNPEVTSVEKK